MAKAVNDATEQKAGDIFQYLVALRDCFELDENDTLQIEVNGDVSIISGNAGRFQKEVKHHFGNSSLNERNIDFWKTLANWYEDFERIDHFSSLVLHTTANIKKTSPFYGWNELSREQKLEKVEQIGSIQKEHEKGFREQYNRIFDDSYDQERLLTILGKFRIIELNDLKAQLKRKVKQQKTNEKSTAYIKKNLQPLMQDYYALLGLKMNGNLTVQKMLRLAENLPEFDDSQFFGEAEIVARYNSLNSRLESLRDQERDLRLRIDRITSASNTGDDFALMLGGLKQQAEAAPLEVEQYTCPLCGHECKNISEDDKELVAATKWLDKELQITEKYTMDFSEDARKLNEELRRINEDVKDTLRQIKLLEKKFMTSTELVSKREKANYAKARIKLFSEMNSTGIFETVDEDIEDLKAEIAKLEDKIAGYDLPAQLNKVQTFLSDNMNRLAGTLDFENDYRPINLNFGLIDQTFDLYHHQNERDKIFLYEMGSGANWVSCHIALFLSFLRLFARNEKSPMPLFLFFDQPSQVYFPRGDEKTNELPPADILAVGNMYQTIFDEVNSIAADTGLLPQVLIVDHVDGHALANKEEFLKHTRYNWTDGNALI